MIQEWFYWFLLVGFTVQVSESDVNDGVSLTFPSAPDEEVSYSLQYAPSLTYQLL